MDTLFPALTTRSTSARTDTGPLGRPLFIVALLCLFCWQTAIGADQASPWQKAPGITLSGVFYASNQAIARAVITGKDQRSKRYSVGETVPKVGIIQEILPGKVVITDGDRRYLWTPFQPIMTEITE